MKRGTHLSAKFIGLASVAFVCACGTSSPTENDPLSDAARNGTGVKDSGSASGDSPGALKEFSFTVPAQARSFDVVFVVDVNGAHRRNGTVNNRFEAAMEGFAARVKFNTGDVRYLLAPSGVPDVDSEGNAIEAKELDKGVGLWREGDGSKEALVRGDGNFLEIFSKRLFERDDESYQFAPIESLKRLATIATGSGTALRAKNGKTFTSVVLISTRPDKTDATPPAEVKKIFDEKFKAGWRAIIVGLPKNGCDVADEEHTIIGGPLKADKSPSNQAYRPLELASALGSQAKFVSICETSFAQMFQDLAANPAGTSGAVVPLGAKAVAQSIEITSPAGPIRGWSYVPGETKLTLPAFLKAGTKLSVRYVVHDGKSANPVPAVVGAPPLVDKKLTPEELEFVQKAAPILDAGCGGCHGGQGGRTRYAGNGAFANVRMNKSTIKDRINKAMGDAQLMPPNNRLDAQKLAALNAYLDSVK